MMIVTEELKDLIENNPISLATVSNEGRPNVIGVACVKVVESDKIIITDNFMNQTKANLEANPNVCLAVWDKDWHGYKFIGQAKYESNGEWLDFVKNLEENIGQAAKGAVVVTVEQCFKLN